MCAALATVLWLEHPTLRRTLAVLALSVVAYLTRAQAVALLPALLTAPFLVAGRRALREFRWLYGLVGGVALGVLAIQGARGRSPLGVLGAYEAAGHSHYSVHKVVTYFVYHVAELDLSLGVFPFAALVLLALVLRRPRPEDAHLRRRGGLAVVLARARGRGVRLGQHRAPARRGAEHVLRLAAPADRAAGLDRARRSQIARARGGGRRCRCGAACGASLLDADQPELGLRHADDPRDLGAAALAVLARRDPGRRGGRGVRGGAALPRDAAAIRSRPARARARVLRPSRRSRSRASTGTPR